MLSGGVFFSGASPCEHLAETIKTDITVTFRQQPQVTNLTTGNPGQGREMERQTNNHSDSISACFERTRNAPADKLKNSPFISSNKCHRQKVFAQKLSNPLDPSWRESKAAHLALLPLPHILSTYSHFEGILDVTTSRAAAVRGTQVDRIVMEIVKNDSSETWIMISDGRRINGCSQPIFHSDLGS